MNTMDIFTPDVAKEIGCIFDVQQTGHPDWVRIFIELPGSICIGRLSFLKGKLNSDKFYKPYELPLGKADKVWYRLKFYINTGKHLPSEAYDRLVVKAKKLHLEDREEKIEARKNLPHKKRPAIRGRSERTFLHNLLRSVEEVKPA